MDGNKDDALRCLKIGKDALELGDKARAFKFFSKARRLDPSLPIDDLISEANQESGNSPATDSVPSGSEASPSNVPNGSSSVRARVPSGKSSESSSVNAYTEEQISIVRQIRRKKDYYEIMGLEKSCPVEDVRKAYRKLSLKVHPDKNKAPGAEEAFKAVSKAFQCLSNEENRKKYDLTGSEEVVYERPRNGSRGFNGFYDGAEVDADEIFRNFFFGGMAPATTGFSGFRFGTGMGPSVRTTEFNGVGNGNLRVLLQILPILLLLLVNFFPSSEPVYSLKRAYSYDHRMASPKGVPYYVKSSRFEQDYPYQSEKRASLEERIEQEYFSIVSENCQMEMRRRQWGLAQQTPHCDLLKKYDVYV